MKILVTGATSMIALAVQRRFLLAGHEIVAVARRGVGQGDDDVAIGGDQAYTLSRVGGVLGSGTRQAAEQKEEDEVFHERGFIEKLRGSRGKSWRTRSSRFGGGG